MSSVVHRRQSGILQDTAATQEEEDRFRRAGRTRRSASEGRRCSGRQSISLRGRRDAFSVVQLLSTLIQIQEMANECWEDKTGFNVVSPVNFSETQLVAKHLIEEGNRTLQVPMHLDMILPKNLSSGVLVQVSPSEPRALSF